MSFGNFWIILNTKKDCNEFSKSDQNVFKSSKTQNFIKVLKINRFKNCREFPKSQRKQKCGEKCECHHNKQGLYYNKSDRMMKYFNSIYFL